MKTRFVITLLLCLCCQCRLAGLYGQEVWDMSLPEVALSGCILSADGEPLPGANIQLVSSFDATQKHVVQSDRDGRFKLSLPMGNYSLTVSYVSFQPYQSQVSATEDMVLPDIKLDEGTSTYLQEVRVVARSITYNAKGYTANISTNPLMKKQSLDNVIRMLPGMGSSGLFGYKLYNREVEAVYVNDRKVSLFGEELADYLSTFKGDNIKSIQAIASSGVEEDASIVGKASLRIYTHRYDDGGRLSVGASARQSAGSFNYRMPSADLQWRVGRLSLYLNASGTYHEKDKSKHSSFTEFAGSNVQHASWNEKATRTNQVSEVFGIGYDFNKHHMLTLEQSYRYKKTTSDKFSQTRVGGASSFTGEENGWWNAGDSQKRLVLSGTYQYSFDSGRFSIAAAYTDASEDADENQQSEDGSGASTYSGMNREVQTYSLYNAKVGLERYLRDGQDYLQAGVAFTGWQRRNDMAASRYLDGIADVYGNYEDLYTYKEQVYAAYVSYDWRYKQWNVLAGLRLEHLRLSPCSYLNPERNHTSHYTDLFPNVAVNYVINQELGHNINVEYSRTIERPDMMSLNPAIRWSNEFNYSMGNPYLTPNYADQLAMRLNFFNHYSLSVDYSRKELFQPVYGQEPDSEVTYSTADNGGHSNNLAIRIGANYNPFPSLMVGIGVTYIYDKYEYKGQQSQNNHWAGGLSVMGDLPFGFNVYANLNYVSPTKDVFSRNSHQLIYMGNIGRTFCNERLDLSLGFSGFNKAYSHIATPTYASAMHTEWSTYSISLTAKYIIKWGNKQARIRQNRATNTGDLLRMGE